MPPAVLRPFPTGETEEQVGINDQVRLKPYSKGAENLVCKSQVGFVERKVKIKIETVCKKVITAVI